MGQTSNRSHYVPGELSLKSLFLAVAFFLALDFAAYWCAGIVFRDLPQQKTQGADAGSKVIELERRLVVLEQSTTALRGQVATANKEVGVIEQNVADLKRATTRPEEVRGQNRPLREKPSKVR